MFADILPCCSSLSALVHHFVGESEALDWQRFSHNMEKIAGLLYLDVLYIKIKQLLLLTLHPPTLHFLKNSNYDVVQTGRW